MLRIGLAKTLVLGLLLLGVTAPAEAQTRPVNSNRAMSTTNLNVRQGPGTNFPVVDVLHRGEEVRIVQCRGNFCLIDHDGPKGWVSRNYLKTLISRTPY